MHLVFYCPKNAFFWDRASTIASLAARRAGIKAASIDEQPPLHQKHLPIFCRFSDLNYARLCRLLGIPYAVDIDDLYWNLPEFSSDRAESDQVYVRSIDRLISGAAFVTTTTSGLRSKILERHPHSSVIPVENCPPAWYAPRPAAVIANTDNFKMSGEDIAWFSKVSARLLDSGCAVQLIGNNDALLQGEDEFRYHSAGRFEFRKYHRFLAERHFGLALIPVSSSAYSDAKSAIKALEFIAQHMAVIASDIAPYRSLKEQYPDLNLTIVENQPEKWLAAIEGALKKFSAEDLRAGQTASRMLFEKRKTQFAQWLSVKAEAERLRSCPGRFWIFSLLARFYRLFKGCRCCA